MSDGKQELAALNLNRTGDSTFGYDERNAHYGLLKDKNVALVRFEYHYINKDQRHCLARRYAWLTRRDLVGLYDPRTGHVKDQSDIYERLWVKRMTTRQVSIHETFVGDTPVLLFLDMDNIPHDIAELVRAKVELWLVSFWNGKFTAPRHRITEQNILWQESSRYSDGTLYEKGASFVPIVTDLARCLQFPSIDAAYTFAMEFVGKLLASDDNVLVEAAKKYIDLKPMRPDKSIRMTGCGKGVAPNSNDTRTVLHARKQMRRLRVLHETAKQRGFTFSDTFLTVKQPHWRKDLILPYKADLELCVRGKSDACELTDDAALETLKSLLSRVTEHKYTLADLRLGKSRRWENGSLLIPLSSPHCLMKGDKHESCRGFFILTPYEMRYGCPSPVCQANESDEEIKQKEKKAKVMNESKDEGDNKEEKQKVTRFVTKLKGAETQAIFFKSNPDDRALIPTKARIELQRGAFMKWEDDKTFKLCPDFTPLAYAIETCESWEERPLVSIVKSGMGTGKSYQIAVKAVVGFDTWVERHMTRAFGSIHKEAEWRGLFKELMDNSKNLIDKLYLLESPKVILTLPRVICVMNLQIHVNDLIKKKVKAALDDDDNSCPIEIREDLHRKICEVICFGHYREVAAKDIEEHLVARVMVCVPSLWKFRDLDFDLVIMDEVERDLLLLTDSSLMRTPKRMLECASALEHFIRTATSEHNPRAEGAYLLDADISARTLEFACDMVSPDRIHVFNNLRENEKLQHKFYNYFDCGDDEPKPSRKGCKIEKKRHRWYRNLLSDLEERNVWCVTGSKEEGHLIENLVVGEGLVPADRVLFINSKSDACKKEMLRDLSVLTKYRLVIVTPVITVGSDFTPEHFDVCYVVSTAYSIDFEQMYQSIGRVRNLRSNVVHLLLGRNSLDRALPTTMDGVKSWFNSRTNATKWIESMVLHKNERKERIMHEEGVKDWLRNVYFQNKLQSNMSKANYMETVLHHLNDKKCAHEHVEYKEVEKAEFKQFKEMLDRYKMNPESKVYEDEVINFLEGPDSLEFEKEVKESKILGRDAGSLDEEEREMLAKWRKMEEDKLRINDILMKDQLHQGMTENENYTAAVVKYLRKIEYAKKGNKPCYEMYKRYTNGSDKRKVDRLMSIDKGIGPRDVLNECQREVSEPGQELMGSSEAARMTAMEKLLMNFKDNSRNHFIGVKHLKDVDIDSLVIDSYDYAYLNDKTAFLNSLHHTAAIVGVAVDKTKKDWWSVKCALDRVLGAFGCLELVPVCRGPECRGFFGKTSSDKKDTCKGHDHSKKVLRRPCNCEEYERRRTCRHQVRSSLFRIMRTKEGREIADAYFPSFPSEEREAQ